MEKDTTFESARTEMVARQIAARGIADPRVLDAMRLVPREAFVRPEDVALAYADRPLPIGAGQTISQPYIVARMIEAAALSPGDRVLEVGGESGYAAAVMGQIAAEVHAVERQAALVEAARRTLHRLGFERVQMYHADGTQGLAEHAPYDAIVVSAGGPLPQALKEQVRIGGRIVIPLPVDGHQALTIVERTGQASYETTVEEPVRFVPLLPAIEGEIAAADAPVPPAGEVAPEPEDISEIGAVMAAQAEPFGGHDALARLVERFADRRIVCLGEATHGTSEFYAARAAITERLVRDHGFGIVAVEADWPDAAAYDAAIRPEARHGKVPGSPFTRFPRWMWRNAETWDLLQRLRAINAGRPPERQAGFYGLDVYSLCASIEAVQAYLDANAPEAAATARTLYGCLKPYCGDPGGYVRAHAGGRYSDCEDRVVQVLTDLIRDRMQDDDAFDAAQNARIVVAAEKYYRSMYHADVQSWNLRDSHMADTLDQVLTRGGPDARAVVWAHNSHIGDATATEMGQRRGEHNLGQLLRERHGRNVALLGFATHDGTVAAADDWGGPVRIKTLRPALEGSHEYHAHQVTRKTGADRFFLDMTLLPAAARAALAEPMLQRAVGVIYRPESERQSHYMSASLSRAFDAWVWFDRTGPLDADASPPTGGDADLFPFGL